MALKLASVLSARIAMRLNSFRLHKKFSIRCTIYRFSDPVAAALNIADAEK